MSHFIQFTFQTPFVNDLPRSECLLSLELLSKFLDIVVRSFATPTHKERTEMALCIGFIDHLGQLLLPRSLNLTLA